MAGVSTQRGGSHRQFKHSQMRGRGTVPGHPGDDVATGTLRSNETGGVEMRYLAIYEKTATGYSAYAPDLPGCITTGPTLEETQMLMQQAIEFHLDGMREDGLPIPEPVTSASYVETAV